MDIDLIIGEWIFARRLECSVRFLSAAIEGDGSQDVTRRVEEQRARTEPHISDMINEPIVCFDVSDKLTTISHQLSHAIAAISG